MMFSKTSVYIESYGAQAKLIYFLIEDYLSEKYNTIWDNVSADIKNQFDSKPNHNKDFSKTKIKSHDNVVTDFYDKKIPKVDSNYTCFAVLSLDYALKKDEHYYSQVFFKEFKYIEKKIILRKFTII